MRSFRPDNPPASHLHGPTDTHAAAPLPASARGHPVSPLLSMHGGCAASGGAHRPSRARALRAVSGCALLAVLFRSSVPVEQRPLAAPRSAPPRGPTAGRARTIRVGPPRGRCVHPTVMGDRDTRSPRRDGFPLSNTDRCSCCLGRTERRARRVLQLQSFLEPVAGNAVHDQRTFPLAR